MFSLLLIVKTTSRPIKVMKIRYLFFIVLFFEFFLIFSCSKKEKTLKPAYKQLTESVYASGSILPKNEYKIYAMADGLLIQSLVQEGDTVKANQALFRIESDIADARFNASKEVYQVSKQNLSQGSPVLRELEIALQNARIKYEQDSINYHRYKNLYEQNATSQIEYDRYATTFKISKNDFLSRKANFEKVKNQLYVDLQNAESQYKINAKDGSNYVVRSTIDGLIFEIYKAQGEAVRRNEALALIGDKKHVYLKLSVDELDIHRIALGQDVLVKVDAYKDKIYKAKVSKIYQVLNKQEQSFRVDADFVEDFPYNFAGLTAEANIIIHQKDKTLTIPKFALVGSDSVLVKKNGEVIKTKIQKGVETLELVEVLNGLSEHDEIIY
ncbi:efflux RND transporter periplasmic adaptor subunit [Thermoflexibacter ruber]|nr:efflux RND transporter periplasmic adaptor subunit [Thermoflexibacter ruber]